MPKRRARQFQVGDFWLAKKPGRGGPDDSWCRCWYDARARQTRYISLETAEVSEAERALTDWFIERHRPVRAQPSEVTVEQVLMNYYEGHAKNLASANQAEIAIGYLGDFFEGDMLAEATRQRQRDYIARRQAEGAADTTIERELSVLGAAVRRAYEEEEIDWLPALISFKAPRTKTRGCFLSYEELVRAFDVMIAEEETWLLMFAVVAISTAARPQASLDLTIFQCDFDYGLVHLNPEGRAQTDKRRPTVPMTSTLRRYLEAVRDGGRGARVVQWGKAARAIGSPKSGIRRLRMDAGLPGDFTAYSFRRTALRHLRRAGVAESNRHAFGGHSSHGVADRYAPYEPGYLGDCAVALDGLFEGLQAMTTSPIIEPAPHLVRAVCVPDRPEQAKRIAAKSLKSLVGERGFEPPAPTSRTKRRFG